MSLLVFASTVAAVQFVHFSDLHMDMLSEPEKFGPYQFCRDPKNMPDGAALARSWQFMKEDRHVKGELWLRTSSDPHASVAAQQLNRLAASANVSYGWMLCDAVPSMVETLFADMATTVPSPDFVVGTGDWVAHLQLSEATTFKTIKTTSEIVQRAYPNAVVIPVVGNNDIFPDYNWTSCASPQAVALYIQWYQWIPNNQVANFLRFGGFEQRLFNGTLRIVALNTVLYHTRNTHFKSVDDPCGQFAFLEHSLAAARADGASVIVVGHVPPKSQATSPSQAGLFFYPKHQIVLLDLFHNYSDVISTTLWGHTHHDEFWTDARGSSVVSGLIAPSVTPLPSNPSYRIGALDATNRFAIVDFTQRYVQLQKATFSGTFAMSDEYKFSSAYQEGPPTGSALVAVRNDVLNNKTPTLRDEYRLRFYTQYDDDINADLCSTWSNATMYWQCRMVEGH